MIYERDLSPVSSKKGVLTKWMTPDKQYYVKASQRYKVLGGNYHIESVMECIAFDVASFFNLITVPYYMRQLERLDGSVLDVCYTPNYLRSFNIPAVESAEVTLVLLHGTGDIPKHNLRYNLLTESFPHLRPHLDRMIVLDFLISNRDRHLKNFEFFSDNRGTYQMAPLYDHGCSLLSDCLTDEDIRDMMDDEDMFDDEFIYGNVQCKSFALEQGITLHLVDRKNIINFNRPVRRSDFHYIVMKYASYLTPTRAEAIVNLLCYRYDRIKRLFS